MAMTKRNSSSLLDYSPTGGSNSNKRSKSSRTNDVDDESRADDDSLFSTAGIIQSIELKNFMCHDHLTVELGQKINFITGRNGSGKSAILAGLVVGLGGKASVMNRGNALRDYIKSGCSGAELRVALRNDGSDAFEPKKYASKIIVERKLLESGGGGYKIKNAHGHVVSNKRDDLNKILDHFNVQLENPMTVLTQDISRQFLQAMKPNKLYEFFMRGTQLEQMRADLNTAAENSHQAIQIFETRSAHLPKIEREVDALKNQIFRHESLQATRTKLNDLGNELAWARVYEHEQLIAEYEQKISQARENMKTAESQTAARKDRLDKAEQSIADISADLQSFDQRFERARTDCQRFEIFARSARTNFKAQQQKIQDLEEKFAYNMRERESIKRALDNLNAGDIIEKLEQIENRKHDCQMLRNRLQEENAKKSDLEKRLQEAPLTIEQTRGDLSSKDSELRASNFKIEKLRQELVNLRDSQQNRLAKFGNFTPTLLNMIDKAWAGKPDQSRKPCGPIGSLLTVTNQQWALAVENCLGGLLGAYVVDNWSDSNELEKLMNLCPGLKRRPQIIISEFTYERYDISRNVPRCPYPNMLSVLDIKDPVIFNTLIDQRGIESIILIQDENEMRQVMQAQKPSREAYSLNGAQCLIHPTFRYYASMKKEPSILVASVEQVIKSHDQELKNLCVMNDGLKLEKEELSNKHAQLVADQKLLHEKMKSFNDAILRYQGQLREIEQELENTTVPAMVEDVLFKQELAEFDAKKAALEQEFVAAKENLNSKKLEMDDAASKYNEAKQKYESMRGENDSLKSKLIDLKDEKRKLEKNLQDLADCESTLIGKVRKFERDLSEVKKQNQELSTEAENMCAREATVYREVEIIENEISRLQQKLQTGEDELGDFDSLLTDYNARKLQLEKMQEEHKELVELRRILEGAQQRRRSFLKEMVSRTVISMKQNFIINLRLRRECSGKLIIDHKEKKLDVEVYTDSKSSQKDLKGLSGGERSFVTVCFLLSMWKLMDTPFRFLDEFDVFMDANNRYLTSQMLCKAFQHDAFGQLTLLTPVDLNLVEDRNIVKIHKLLAPARLSSEHDDD